MQIFIIVYFINNNTFILFFIIAVIFHKITVYLCIFDQIYTALMSIRNFKKIKNKLLLCIVVVFVVLFSADIFLCSFSFIRSC